MLQILQRYLLWLGTWQTCCSPAIPLLLTKERLLLLCSRAKSQGNDKHEIWETVTSGKKDRAGAYKQVTVIGKVLVLGEYGCSLLKVKQNKWWSCMKQWPCVSKTKVHIRSLRRKKNNIYSFAIKSFGFWNS